MTCSSMEVLIKSSEDCISELFRDGYTCSSRALASSDGDEISSSIHDEMFYSKFPMVTDEILMGRRYGV